MTERPVARHSGTWPVGAGRISDQGPRGQLSGIISLNFHTNSVKGIIISFHRLPAPPKSYLAQSSPPHRFTSHTMPPEITPATHPPVPNPFLSLLLISLFSSFSLILSPPAIPFLFLATSLEKKMRLLAAMGCETERKAPHSTFSCGIQDLN